MMLSVFGKTHDTTAVAENGPLDILDPGNAIGDLATWDPDAHAFCTPQDANYSTGKKGFNTSLTKLRYVIANFKFWQCIYTVTTIPN